MLFMGLTKIICCNCRGVSGYNIVSCIVNMMKKVNPLIFYLVETRVNTDRLDCFCSKLNKRWCWAALEAVAYLGGVITIWRNQLVLVTLVAVPRHTIHLVISLGNFVGWILSVVYNTNKTNG